MVLKLDSRVPVVWRTPTSVQLGVDPPRVVFDDVTTVQERMLAALESGVSRPGLDLIARESGSDERDVDRLLAAVAPAMEPDGPRAGRRPVSVVGTGPTAERIAEALADVGLRVRATRAAEDGEFDLAIAVGHFVLDPDYYGFWLRRDQPHLPVIFGDSATTIGPLVEPGFGPCLYCLERYRSEADPAWPAIAAQLWGRRSAAETPLSSAEVAAAVARMAVRRLSLGVPGDGSSIRLSPDTGAIERRTWKPHPACGCISMLMDERAQSA